jgi:hypothetical protein
MASWEVRDASTVRRRGQGDLGGAAGCLGTIQLVVYAFAVLRVGDFRIVILNYAPVMLLLLLMSVRGLKRGTGSWQMVVGVLVLLAASAVQALDVDVFNPLDQNGLYHAISFVGVLFMYWGGQRLKVT